MLLSPNRTVISIDLAHSVYANNGLAVLTQEAGRLTVDLPRLPLQGTPDPHELALFLTGLASERGANLIFLDGPQAWRDPTEERTELRVCERKLAAPAKTGLPGHVKPANYTPFVTFSIHVFDALDHLGWPRLLEPDAWPPSSGRHAIESFPLAAWRSLQIPSLPAKAKAKPHDITSRFDELQKLAPITIAGSPNHDQLQAIVAGLAGFPDLFHVSVAGVRPRTVDGVWREGFIVLPKRRSASNVHEEQQAQFTVQKRRWYAWQMVPGYSSEGYFSPIHVSRFTPLKTGTGLVEVAFFNAGYAEGVQGFLIKARVMKRTRDFLLLDLSPNGQTERVAIISELTFGWLKKHHDQVFDRNVDSDDVQELLDLVYEIEHE